MLLPKNVIFEESNRLRIARRAGVHKMASPIGEGSQISMLSFASFILLDSTYQKNTVKQLKSQIQNPKQITITKISNSCRLSFGLTGNYSLEFVWVLFFCDLGFQ
jgi:hypothetical protein